jgi:predicted membrane protein
MKWVKVVAFWVALLVSNTLLFQAAHSSGTARSVEALIGVLGIAALAWIVIGVIREQKKLMRQVELAKRPRTNDPA